MDISSIKQPIFGSWYIEEEIGSGSFGTVFKIRQETPEKTYYSALKVIRVPQNDGDIQSVRSELGDDDSVRAYYDNFVQNFFKEIEVMSELKGYKNIVGIEDHDYIANDDGFGGTILIRMELLTPFTSYLGTQTMQQTDVLRLGIDICSALEICEQKKIIHRDIKPDNIFVAEDGSFKLGDFGIARELEKTMGGLSKKGTYNYMAPEVYLGKPYNRNVDIYSLGIVLYKLLNRNRTPFLPPAPTPITFSDRESSIARRMQGEPIPFLPELSAPLNNILQRSCAFDPAARYHSASEMKAALICCMTNGQSGGITPPPNPDPIGDDDGGGTVGPEFPVRKLSQKKNKKLLLLIPAVLLILVVIIVAVVLLSDSGSSSSSGYTPAPVYEDEGTEADWNYDTTATDKQNDSDSPVPSSDRTTTTTTTTTQPAEDIGVLPPKTTIPADEPEPEVDYDQFDSWHAEELLYGPAERALYTVPDAVDTGYSVEADGITFYYNDSRTINEIVINGGYYSLYTVQCDDPIDYAVNTLPDYGFETFEIDPDDYQYAHIYMYESSAGNIIELETTEEGYISAIDVY